MILDTSFLLYLKDGDRDAFEKAIEMYDAGVVQRVALPSVMELHYGATFTQSDEERRRVQNLLLMYPVVGLDEETARRAGELLAEADRREDGDSGVDNEDGLIAAVAEQVDEPVLTGIATISQNSGSVLKPTDVSSANPSRPLQRLDTVFRVLRT